MPSRPFASARVIRGLDKNADEDTPERVVPWLTGDPRIWFSLLTRDDVRVRGIAVEQLAKLLDAELDFDPEAAPDQREQQRKRLHERFGAIVDPPSSADGSEKTP